MPHIIHGAKTKKALREVIASDPGRIYFEDPSIFPGAWSGTPLEMRINQTLICTNHPRRSWFASITRTSPDTWRIS